MTPRCARPRKRVRTVPGGYGRGVSGRYDPERAAAAMAEFAAVSAAEEAADIRTAVVAMLDAVDAWCVSPRWKGWAYHQKLVRLGAAVRAALDQLPADAAPGVVADTVRPLLGEVWGDETVEAAVDQLRGYAMHRPSLYRDARRLTGRQDERDRGHRRSTW